MAVYYIFMRVFLLGFGLAALASAQPLHGTGPLEIQGDPAEQMVEGITRYLLRQTIDGVSHRAPSRERLRQIIGVVDKRVPYTAPELIATTTDSALLAENDLFRVYAVRWPALEGISAEGLLFEPKGRVVARVVAIPDADQLPEQFRISQELAGSGCQVLSPVLIDRRDRWSGNPRIRMTNQPHREFIYRMAFMVGRHILGYEVQKTLAALDWFSAQSPKLPIGIWGYGEGGAVALLAAALDERIAATSISGYFQPREGLWKQPLDHNVFGLLKDFGDAELAGMVAPRTLVIDTTPGPKWDGPSQADPKRRGAAPGALAPASQVEIEREVARARNLRRDSRIVLSEAGMQPFLRALGADRRTHSGAELPVRDPSERQRRQFEQMIAYTQQLASQSHLLRETLWAKTEGIQPDEWNRVAPKFRAQLWDEVIGRLPRSGVPLNVKSRNTYHGAKWEGYEVTYDVLPDVFGYGVLLLPRDIQPGERRPVVVGQHGLEGRPQFLFGLPENDRENGAYTNFHYYQNIGSRFADLGYVVYLPQNPYIGDFRQINRLANPLGWSLFSFILAQHDRALDWLSSLPFVDASRIGFYGLSYGGKTAVRAPPLLDRYALSVCSGDFNEWVHKVTTLDDPNSYMFTHEYEIPEFNLAAIANHAEMAKMMAPRPFMVERGHRDGVGFDEWIAFEYAKVKRFYDEMGIGDRTELEYFNGPHMIHGVGSVAFVRKYLGR
jgi:dienelactone hydrolase